MRPLLLVGLIILLVTSGAANAQFSELFGPSNFDECILESMKGVTSDRAANIIASSCRSKFPAKATNSASLNSLTNEQLSKITTVDGSWSAGTIKLSIHNANAFCVDSLVYRIAKSHEGSESTAIQLDLQFREELGQRIGIETVIEPLAISSIAASAGDLPSGYTWSPSLLSGKSCAE